MIDEYHDRAAELAEILDECRDCVAESLDRASTAPNKREVRVAYLQKLLNRVDTALRMKP